MNFLHTYLPDSIFLDIGFVSIHWYGLLMTLAVVAGFFVARYLFKRYQNIYLFSEVQSEVQSNSVEEISPTLESTELHTERNRKQSNIFSLDHLYNLSFYLIIFLNSSTKAPSTIDSLKADPNSFQIQKQAPLISYDSFLYNNSMSLIIHDLRFGFAFSICVIIRVI